MTKYHIKRSQHNNDVNKIKFLQTSMSVPTEQVIVTQKLNVQTHQALIHVSVTRVTQEMEPTAQVW